MHIHIITVVLGDSITTYWGIGVSNVKSFIEVTPELVKSGFYGVATDYNISDYDWS